jgi:hypothetical protein
MVFPSKRRISGGASPTQQALSNLNQWQNQEEWELSYSGNDWKVDRECHRRRSVAFIKKENPPEWKLKREKWRMRKIRSRQLLLETRKQRTSTQSSKRSRKR